MSNPFADQSRRAGLPDFSATYFRTYGVHTIPGDDPIHLFSFPTWEQLEPKLQESMPDSGTILTTEHAVFPQPQDQIPAHGDLIEERIRSICELSRTSGVRILLGTPFYDVDTRAWRNSVLDYKDGVAEARNDKCLLSGYEQEVRVIQSGLRNSRQARSGRMVLICSELLLPRIVVHPASNPHTVLAPMCWAVPTPSFDQGRAELINNAGGADNYFRSALERAVGRTFRDLSSVQRVIVVDRTIPNSGCEGPFNAVFDRLP